MGGGSIWGVGKGATTTSTCQLFDNPTLTFPVEKLNCPLHLVWPLHSSPFVHSFVHFFSLLFFLMCAAMAAIPIFPDLQGSWRANEGPHLVWSASICFFNPSHPCSVLLPYAWDLEEPLCKSPPCVSVGVQMTMGTWCHKIAGTATHWPQEDDKDNGYCGHNDVNVLPLSACKLCGWGCIVQSPACVGEVVRWGRGGMWLCHHRDWGGHYDWDCMWITCEWQHHGRHIGVRLQSRDGNTQPAQLTNLSRAHLVMNGVPPVGLSVPNNSSPTIDDVQWALSSLDLSDQVRSSSTVALFSSQSNNLPCFNPNQSQQSQYLAALHSVVPNNNDGINSHQLQLITNPDECSGQLTGGSSGLSVHPPMYHPRITVVVIIVWATITWRHKGPWRVYIHAVTL